MGWDALIPIIAKEGFEVGYALWQKWNTKQLPTEEDWAELRKLRTIAELRAEVEAQLPPQPDAGQ